MKLALYGKDLTLPTAPASWQQISDSNDGSPYTILKKHQLQEIKHTYQ